MNKPVTVAVLQAGLLPKNVIHEMSRWGLPLSFVEDQRVLASIEEVIGCLREAVESDDAVTMRDTDLDALSHYLRNHKEAKLRIFAGIADVASVVTVTYTVLPNGRYLIPWIDESIADAITDQRSYLKVGDERISFSEVEELFVGGKKALIYAKPATKESP